MVAPSDGRVLASTTGLNLHYRDWGGPSPAQGGQTPVVLLHGLASSCRIYDLCAPLLAPTRRVVAYDQRGHGETDRPEDGYEIATFVADGAGLAQALHLPEPYLVVGHSWGATVALEWAVRHPRQVQAVVLVDGAIVPFREAPGATWERLAARLAPPDLSGVTFDDLLERTRVSLGFLDQAFRRSFFEALMEITADGSVRARLPRDKHMRILRMLWDEDVDAAFRELHRTALALLAERAPSDAEAWQMEEMRHRMAERLQQGQPLLRVHWLQDTIHDVPLQRPALLAEAILGADTWSTPDQGAR
ncbi:MAG TPA: alpha/beta hydrolase [Chloroflexota bacterium]|nr:alpha/beta hydrolase [Chloroflexota bacterium]